METLRNPGQMAQLHAVIPLGRMAELREIAGRVVRLASDQASLTTIFSWTVA